MLIVATAVVAGLTGAPVIDATAHGIDRVMLIAALNAPDHATSPRGKRRYCFEDRITDPATTRLVCRTLAEWRRLGLEPVAG